jgi:hypothetical protein
VKTLTRNWRDHKRTGTHKHTETVSRYFDWHSCLSQSKENFYSLSIEKDGRASRNISIQFPYNMSFCVFVCVWPFVIPSIPGKSFHFPFPNLWFSYFGTFFSTSVYTIICCMNRFTQVSWTSSCIITFREFCNSDVL